MAKKITNYEELKNYIPANDNEENYALLTHYLLMPDGINKENKKSELIKNYEFEAEKVAEAEHFFATKNVPF